MSASFALLLFAAQSSTPAPAPSPATPPATVAAPRAPETAGSAMSLDQARLVQCRQAIEDDPAEAVLTAGDWIGTTATSPFAHQCLGLAYMAQQEFASAASAFGEAARLSASDNRTFSAGLSVNAGSAALTAGDGPGARRHLDSAINAGVLSGPALGNAYVERARSAVLTNDLATARSDLEAAKPLVASDAMVWLLSATLHRRQNQLAEAQADIQQAATLSPRDPAIALEAGNIAVGAGNLGSARASWQSVLAISTSGAAAQAARAHLAELDRFEREEGTRAAQNAATAPGVPVAPSAPQPTPQPAPQ